MPTTADEFITTTRRALELLVDHPDLTIPLTAPQALLLAHALQTVVNSPALPATLRHLAASLTHALEAALPAGGPVADSLSLGWAVEYYAPPGGHDA